MLFQSKGDFDSHVEIYLINHCLRDILSTDISKIFDTTGKMDIGRQFMSSVASPVLYIGTTVACFQRKGKVPVTIDVFIIHVR